MDTRRLTGGRRRAATLAVTAWAAGAVALLGGLACSGDDAPGPATPTPAPTGRVSTPVTAAYSAAGPEPATSLEGAAEAAQAGDGAAPAQVRFSNPLPDGAIPPGGEFRAAREGTLVHGGIDISLATGTGATAVNAPCDGTVVARGVDDRTGRYVEMDCGGGVTVRVGFLGEVTVDSGARVGRGTPIGRLDASLRSVHVEMRIGGQFIDPSLAFGFIVIPPTPTPIPTPTGTPTVAASGEPPVPTPAASATPTDQPSPGSTATATLTPRPPTATPTPTSVPTATPTQRPPTFTPTNTPRPIVR